MLYTLCAITIASWVLFRGSQYVRAIRKHANQAAQSGWPCFLSPYHLNDTTYLLTHKMAASMTKWLPQDLIRKSLPWTTLLRVWHAGYKPFEDVGSDSFMLSAATGNMLVTCDPNICHEIMSKGNNFKAPVEMLYVYNIYGPTMAACEDDEWRRYRKVTTPYFNQTTDAAVWRESLQLTNAIMGTWAKVGYFVKDIKQAVTARVTIGVIAKVFYGLTIRLEDFEIDEKKTPDKKITFACSLLTVVRNLGIIIVTPGWLATHSPLKINKTVNRAYAQFKQYTIQMHEEVTVRLQTIENTDKKHDTFIESLVASGCGNSTNIKAPKLSQDEIFGNSFFFLMAGHDTSSTTAAFAILLLALHPNFQLKLQQNLDGVLKNRPWTKWDYKTDFQPLFEGYTGAVIKETLRLYHPVEYLPKRAQRDVTVTDHTGAQHIIPRGTICMLDFAAAFRHPQYWPTPGPDSCHLRKIYPAFQFNPDRWIKDGSQDTDRSASAFFPFGGGQRSCPGRRFAETQLISMLASIFSRYSVELVPLAADLEEAKAEKRSDSWLRERTRDRAATSLYDGIGFTHAIYPSQHSPIKFFKRS